MEATNISINQSSSVSINVETHLWLRVKGAWFMVLYLAKRQSRAKGAWSLPRLYRKVLRAMYAAERATERHSTIADGVLLILGIALAVEVIFFA